MLDGYKALFTFCLRQILAFARSTVDSDALFKALVAGELAEPGFLGPLKEVLRQRDAIFLDKTIAGYAEIFINWVIDNFGTRKLATLAVAHGLTPETVVGAHAATDSPIS